MTRLKNEIQKHFVTCYLLGQRLPWLKSLALLILALSLVSVVTEGLLLSVLLALGRIAGSGGVTFGQSDSAAGWCAWAGLLIAAKSLASFFQTQLMARLQVRFTADLRELGMRAVFSSELPLRMNGNSSGGLLHTLSQQSDYAFHYLGTLFAVAHSLLLYVGYISLMVFLSWPSAVALLIVTALAAYFFKHANKKIFGLARDRQLADERLTRYLLDDIQSLFLIRAYNIMEARLSRLAQKNAEFCAAVTRLARYRNFLGPALNLAIAVTFFGFAYVLGSSVSNLANVLLLPFLATLLVAIRLQPHFAGLGGALLTLGEFRPSLRAVQRLIANADLRQETRVYSNYRVDRLELNDVYFSYDQQKPVLAGVNFSAARGEIVAILGTNGSGKSTLGMLLAGVIDSSRGAYTLTCGDRVTRVNQDLRPPVGWVPESAFITEGSVLENIAFGRDASLVEVQQAAQEAEIHDFVSTLGQGYLTTLGSMGPPLSNGQKQRIALARAFLHSPSILVLDEALSGLDFSTRTKILRRLRALSENCVIIIVTHDASVAAYADRQLELKDGRLVLAHESERRTVQATGV